MDDHNTKGMRPEIPEKNINKPKEGVNVFGEIIKVICILFFIMISLPIIICGSFISPVIPLATIVGLVFAIKWLVKNE